MPVRGQVTVSTDCLVLYSPWLWFHENATTTKSTVSVTRSSLHVSNPLVHIPVCCKGFMYYYTTSRL